MQINILDPKMVLGLSPSHSIVLYSLLVQHASVRKLLSITSASGTVILILIVTFFIRRKYKIDIKIEKKPGISTLLGI